MTGQAHMGGRVSRVGGRPRGAVSPDVLRRVEESLSASERAELSVIPAMACHVAWEYAWKARDYCRDRRMGGEFIRLSRRLDEARSRYVRETRHDNDTSKAIGEVAAAFMDMYRKDLSLLWFSINNEMLRVSPGIGDEGMRTDACVALCVTRVLRDRCMEVSGWLRKRAGVAMAIPDSVERMADVMRGYLGGVDVSGSGHVRTCLYMLGRDMDEIGRTLSAGGVGAVEGHEGGVTDIRIG